MARFPFLFLICLVAGAVVHGAPETEGFLRTKGNEIQDNRGRAVHLRGVNLGGWLVIEPWMCPVDSSGTIKDEHSLRRVLGERFGEETARSLLATYQDHWITAKDLDKIAAHGLNLIRVPFWYRNLQSEDGVWDPGGIRRLDWVVNEAWKRGIYTILDLHGVPGGQTKGESTGRERAAPEFWNNEENMNRTVAIWGKVAAHFKGHPGVAAYDLINEPDGAPALGTLWAAYDRLYRAIRGIDPDHIITVEGCLNTRFGEKQIHWGWDALPHPDFFGWKNVLYQLHHYEWDWNNLEKQINGTDFHVRQWKAHQHLGVPAYMGEFNPMAREKAWLHAMEQFTAAGMHWSFWTYKANHGTGSDSWGLYNPLRKESPNLLTDDAESIRAKWQALDTDLSYAVNPMIERVLKSMAGTAADR